MAATTNLESSNVNALASIVQKVGIPLNLEDPNPRFEALTFIVKANETCKTAELIKEITQLAASAAKDIKEAACKVSFRLHKEVSSLLGREMNKIELSQKNEEYKCGARAVHNLYIACKKQHPERYAKGEIVNFAGVPYEFILGITS